MKKTDRIRKRLDAAEKLRERDQERASLLTQLIDDARWLLEHGEFRDEDEVITEDIEP